MSKNEIFLNEEQTNKINEFIAEINQNRECYNLLEGIERISELIEVKINLDIFEINIDDCFDLDLNIHGVELEEKIETLITFTLTNEANAYDELEELYDIDKKDFSEKATGYWHASDWEQD